MKEEIDWRVWSIYLNLFQPHSTWINDTEGRVKTSDDLPHSLREGFTKKVAVLLDFVQRAG